MKKPEVLVKSCPSTGEVAIFFKEGKKTGIVCIFNHESIIHEKDHKISLACHLAEAIEKLIEQKVLVFHSEKGSFQA